MKILGIFTLALFASLVAGCGQTGYVVRNQAPAAKVCDMSRWYCQNVYAAPYTAPIDTARLPVYYSPYTPYYGRPSWYIYWHKN